MKNIAWLSANKFGFVLLRTALNIAHINYLIVPSPKSKTIIYDSELPPYDICKSKNIYIHETDNINGDIEYLKQLNLDLLVMCGWREVLNSEILKCSKLTINFHPTLLPQGRGACPIINTILNGWGKSGVTMYKVAEGLDNGDIIAQRAFNISPQDYAEDIYNKVIKAGKYIVRNYLKKVIDNSATFIRQDDTKATFLLKRSYKRDNKINLKLDSPEEIYRKIRAFSHPYRGAYIELGNKKLTIWKAELSEIT